MMVANAVIFLVMFKMVLSREPWNSGYQTQHGGRGWKPLQVYYVNYGLSDQTNGVPVTQTNKFITGPTSSPVKPYIYIFSPDSHSVTKPNPVPYALSQEPGRVDPKIFSIPLKGNIEFHTDLPANIAVKNIRIKIESLNGRFEDFIQPYVNHVAGSGESYQPPALPERPQHQGVWTDGQPIPIAPTPAKPVHQYIEATNTQATTASSIQPSNNVNDSEIDQYDIDVRKDSM